MLVIQLSKAILLCQSWLDNFSIWVYNILLWNENLLLKKGAKNGGKVMKKWIVLLIAVMGIMIFGGCAIVPLPVGQVGQETCGGYGYRTLTDNYGQQYEARVWIPGPCYDRSYYVAPLYLPPPYYAPRHYYAPRYPHRYHRR